MRHKATYQRIHLFVVKLTDILSGTKSNEMHYSQNSRGHRSLRIKIKNQKTYDKFGLIAANTCERNMFDDMAVKAFTDTGVMCLMK